MKRRKKGFIQHYLNSVGFTLLEILVVISIIGILIAVAAVAYSSAQKQSRDAKRRADLKAVQNGLEQYYGDNNGSYPDDTYSLSTLPVTYFPGGEPKDPKTSCGYVSATWTTSAYSVCADLETDGAYGCLSDCTGGCTNNICVTNLQ